MGTTVALKPKVENQVSTPATVSLKQPTVMGVAGLNVDKLEYKSDGSMALEAGLGKELHKVDGLSVTLKSDLVNLKKISKEITFTGIADTQIKIDAKPMALK